MPDIIKEFGYFGKKLTAKQITDLNTMRHFNHFEADRIENALARALIRTVCRENHGKCYLGKYYNPGLTEYRYGMVRNFECDFVLPQFDEIIYSELKKLCSKQGDHNTIFKISTRLREMNGYPVFWT